MRNLTMLEAYYKKFTDDLNIWLPEDIIEVDNDLLKQLNLKDSDRPEVEDSSLTRYFHVVEANDKITLINDQYIVWIVPEKNEDDRPVTFTFIAKNETEPQLELCFYTAGVYNTSKLVLRLLEKFLSEVEENTKILNDLESST